MIFVKENQWKLAISKKAFLTFLINERHQAIHVISFMFNEILFNITITTMKGNPLEIYESCSSIPSKNFSNNFFSYWKPNFLINLARIFNLMTIMYEAAYLYDVIFLIWYDF